ncbi:MAG: phosphatidic acid phosphatase [Clostridia bacterium]|nr:phosphatidic acid phosphatase [Clostridia bacterium]
MKKPVVDYREFRLSRLNEPRFAHLKLLAGWILYFVLYFLTENLIPAERCHVMHCALDDAIPFCEVFVVPYCLWFLLVAGSLLYFMLYDIDSFRGLSVFIFVTQMVAMAIYILYPSRQDLRPDVMPRQNLFTFILSFIYAFDTSTGVCPSLHVAYSIGIASTWLKYRGASAGFKALIVAFVVVICLATAFVKQHSFVDIFAALPLSVLAEIIAYGRRWWLPRLRRQVQ